MYEYDIYKKDGGGMLRYNYGKKWECIFLGYLSFLSNILLFGYGI